MADYTPEQIQQAMKMSKAAGDQQATADLRGMLATAYSQEDYGGAASESGTENLMAGLASGVVDVGRKATNLALPESMTPEWASDEAISEQANLDTDLMDTKAGLVGNLVGGAAATAPIGMGAGGLALKAGSKLLPRALSAAGKGAKVGRGMVQGAAQGLSEGAVISSPDNRGMGAGVGGVLGAAMPLVARTAGALMRKLGRPAVAVTDDSNALLAKMRESGIEDPFIPLSQSAEPGIIRQLYQGIIANVPGNKIRPQYGAAVDDLRQAVLHEVVPDGVPASAIFEAGDDIRDGFRLLSREWDDVWKPVNDADVLIPANMIPDEVIDMGKKLSNGQFSVPQPGPGQGQKLTTLSQQLQELADMSSGALGKEQADVFITMKNKVDNILGAALPDEQAALWRANKNKYSLYQDLLAGTKGKMGSGEFPASALSQATAKRSGQVGGVASNPLQELGHLGEKALPDFPSKLGVFQTLAATGAAGTAAGTAYAFADEYPVLKGVAAFLSPFVGARIASKPSFQRALTSGWGKARAAGMTADKYKKFLESMGFTSRQIAVSAATDKE